MKTQSVDTNNLREELGLDHSSVGVFRNYCEVTTKCLLGRLIVTASPT